MSTNEFYAGDARSEGKPSRRFAIILLAILFAVCVLGAAAYFIAKHRVAPSNNGGAQGAATVSSPNEAQPAETAPAKRGRLQAQSQKPAPVLFHAHATSGRGPSPHSYCYPFYSYHIRKGNYGDITLDDLHFGSADLRSGRYMFIDERANDQQREALRLIMARVIERVPANEAEKKAKEIAESVRYEAVEQTYDDRKNHLKVAGLGEFAADYVMGLDKQAPVVVRNNTTWRVRETIKAKTSFYRVKLGRDVVDTKDTNSNQGEFEYTDAMDFGALPAGTAARMLTTQPAARANKRVDADFGIAEEIEL